MSRRKGWVNCKNIIPVVLASIGIGMLCVLILPFWIWILGIGAGLIIYAIYSYSDK